MLERSQEVGRSVESAEACRIIRPFQCRRPAVCKWLHVHKNDIDKRTPIDQKANNISLCLPMSFHNNFTFSSQGTWEY